MLFYDVVISDGFYQWTSETPAIEMVRKNWARGSHYPTFSQLNMLLPACLSIPDLLFDWYIIPPLLPALKFPAAGEGKPTKLFFS